MKRSLARFAPALALWLAAASGAHANPNYTYDFNIRQIDVRLNSREGGGYVAVTSTPKVSGITAGTIPVVALNWLPVVNPSAYGVTQHLDATQNGGIFQITLSLTDDTTGKQKTLTFDGLLTGSFKITQDAGLGLHPDAEFVGGGSGGNPLKNPVQTATVGDYDFTVDLSHYVLPPNPLNPTAASIGGSITAKLHDDGGVGVAKTPEPSTLLLSCVGLSLAGAASWRKRRRGGPAGAGGGGPAPQPPPGPAGGQG